MAKPEEWPVKQAVGRPFEQVVEQVFEQGRRPARPAASRWRWLCVGLLALSPCCTAPYRPLRLQPVAELPGDAFARCKDVLRARYRRLAVADESRFLLQTDWAPGPIPDVACQQRATVFLDDGAVAVVVEARYLAMGWFDSHPDWTLPRPDDRLEEALGEALQQALRP
jgi:hypothetical protein